MSALNNQSVKNTLENNLSRKLETGLVEDESLLLGKAHHNNTLDRNGDGIIDARDNLLGVNRLSQGYVQSNQRGSLGLVRTEPIVKEVIQKEAVVHERIHPVQKEEIQPIIYREREQLDIKQVTQVLHETQIQPTILQQRELPAERRGDIIERGAAITPNTILPTSSISETTRVQQINAPIVEETIRKTILEEIQPVLERDVYQSTVIQNTQPIYEVIREAPRVSREIRQVGDVDSRRLSQGYIGAPLSQGYNDVNMVSNVQTFSEPIIQNRRLSQNYDQTIYNESLLTNRGLQGVNTQNVPLSQGEGFVQGLGYAQPLNNNNRLSQGYVAPLVGSSSYNQGYLQNNQIVSDPLYQNRRLSQGFVQPFGVNVGPAPMAGMNNTGLGLASAVPINTAAPMYASGLTRGFNEQSNIYSPGFAANNLVTSIGINGTHSVAGSVNSTEGNTIPRAPMSMTPVSVLEQGLINNRLSQNYGSNSAYGLQGTPVYQNTVQAEKLREMEREQILREQMLRQQNPMGFNAI